MSTDLHLTDPRDTLKMLRETLCIAQTVLGYLPSYSSRIPEHRERIQRMIDEIDRQRPLGPGGKHGELHTPSCGCERFPDALPEEHVHDPIKYGCELTRAGAPRHPTVVCLCGSTRFSHAFREANLRETLAGRIVLSIGCDMRSDAELFADLDEAAITRIKSDLDDLHKRKIDLADEVLVLNVGGHVGDSTRSEIEYATGLGRPIRWLEPVHAFDAQLVESAEEPNAMKRQTMPERPNECATQVDL